MTTKQERRALLAYAKWWARTAPLTPAAMDGLRLIDDGMSGQRYLAVHKHDYLLFPRIAESLAYDGTDGP